ncbi:MAG: type I restriction-modification system subunit M N-terminal domain-containing protein [Planctomycetaceae bacterium]|nr:type I restriction-modification system subunit M N-terminal domain-containing protein [Planctomycetaceae bacterium]
MSEQQAAKIDQDEINSILWKAWDTFRGVVDPAEYKNYILVMLFVKYLPDVWQDQFEKLKEAFYGDEDRIRRRLKRERFVLPESCSFKEVYSQRNESNLGEIIDLALEEIEEANKK